MLELLQISLDSLKQLTWTDILYGAVILGTSGAALKAWRWGKKYAARVKELAEDNENWYDIAADLVKAAIEQQNEIKDFVGQMMVLSKAVADKDNAIDRIKANKALREKFIAQTGNPDPGAAAELADLLIPVKAGIRHYGGMDTDKLAKLKDSMESNLSKQEATNKVLKDSGRMAKAIAMLAAKVAPQLLSGGKFDVEQFLAGLTSKDAEEKPEQPKEE